MYIQAYKTNNLRMKIIKNDFPNHHSTWRGPDQEHTLPAVPASHHPAEELHHPLGQTAPSELTIWLINFSKLLGGLRKTE